MTTCYSCKCQIEGEYYVRPFAYGVLHEEIGISFLCSPCGIGRKLKENKLKIKIERQKMKIKFEAI